MFSTLVVNKDVYIYKSGTRTARAGVDSSSIVCQWFTADFAEKNGVRQPLPVKPEVEIWRKRYISTRSRRLPIQPQYIVYVYRPLFRR